MGYINFTKMMKNCILKGLIVMRRKQEYGKGYYTNKALYRKENFEKEEIKYYSANGYLTEHY